MGEVRAGLGFLAGIDVTPEALTRRSGIVRDWQRACRAEGILVRPLARGIAVSPPLICGREEIALLADGIGAALDRLGAATRVAA